MWFRHRWKFCVFHHKKELSFVYFLTNSSGSVFQLSETNILDIVIVIDFGQLANIGEYWFWRRLQRSGARGAESPLRNKLSNIRGNYSPQPLSQNWRECCPQKIKDGQSSLCLHSSSLKSLSILKTKQSNASIPAPSSFLIFPLHGDKQIKRAHGLQINPFRTSYPAVWP